MVLRGPRAEPFQIGIYAVEGSVESRRDPGAWPTTFEVRRADGEAHSLDLLPDEVPALTTPHLTSVPHVWAISITCSSASAKRKNRSPARRPPARWSRSSKPSSARRRRVRRRSWRPRVRSRRLPPKLALGVAGFLAEAQGNDEPPSLAANEGTDALAGQCGAT